MEGPKERSSGLMVFEKAWTSSRVTCPFKTMMRFNELTFYRGSILLLARCKMPSLVLQDAIAIEMGDQSLEILFFISFFDWLVG